MSVPSFVNFRTRYRLLRKACISLILSFAICVQLASAAMAPTPPAARLAGVWTGAIADDPDCRCRMEIFECSFVGSGPASRCLFRLQCDWAPDVELRVGSACARTMDGVLESPSRASLQGTIEMLGFSDSASPDRVTRAVPTVATGTWQLYQYILVLDRVGVVHLTRYVPVGDDDVEVTAGPSEEPQVVNAPSAINEATVLEGPGAASQ